ncbi:hypothetical protein P4S93_09395 [Aneurinibacillus thermoaerophilus]|uniref:Copper amine oxidase N-terminal domain-containing protein n=1 Tax=Aneurinibacillus thermoaerophilus TaxID=143495 RepID=A0A1G7YX75_ANETH|nr:MULTISPECIES: hypothetical protein [Aneurinibacillus]AMA73183.1 hypothetical protein ACH33_10135 [Aneurinibacillus sp. XH2]MED0758696.1 hypothetical protein [Aneurinibacillus thermoaerophilus]MED0760993.1 hypothetical protein [Aneurinibacillus thermoaerophilus]QYY44265.1 hypothetical protein K3F53_08860 [Aneurinibacillus thermoaerophilus]SDH00460.1 hypothetical protein SAMN04489735_100818 [Aneurinibacillus thermoaerophilus]
MKQAFYRISLLLFLLMGMLSAVVQAAPAPSIQLWMNGERMKPKIPPQIQVNGQAVTELFGQNGSWDKGKTTYSISSKAVNEVDEKPKVVIEKVKITGLVQKEEMIEIEANGEVQAKHFTMNNPFRI